VSWRSATLRKIFEGWNAKWCYSISEEGRLWRDAAVSGQSVESHGGNPTSFKKKPLLGKTRSQKEIVDINKTLYGGQKGKKQEGRQWVTSKTSPDLDVYKKRGRLLGEKDGTGSGGGTS